MGAGESKKFDEWRASQVEETKQAAEVLPAWTKEPLDKLVQDGFSGDVLLPGRDDAYHRVRTDTYNYDAQGTPAAIVQPRTAQDIVLLLAFAQENDAEVCVSGGKHSVKCMVTGSLCIDLHAHMADVTVDAAEKRVRVGGGAKLGMMDAALGPHNLIMPTGTNPDTGVGGLTLAGGWGWVCRKYGVAVDHLVSAEVVLTDGRIVTASKDSAEYADLFWALRGGGAGFGIVTMFEFRCHTRPQMTIGSVVTLVPTYHMAFDTLKRYVAFAASAPDEVTGAMVIPFGKPVLPAILTYAGPDVQDEQAPRGLISPLSDVPEPLRDVATNGFGGLVRLENKWETIPYPELQELLTEKQGSSHQVHTAMFLTRADDDVLHTLLHYFRTAPPAARTGSAIALLAMLGGAASRDPPEGTSFSRTNKFFVAIEGTHKIGQLAPMLQWSRDLREALRKMGAVSDATYADGGAQELMQDESKLARLRTLKAKYDPKNLLHQNGTVQAMAPGSNDVFTN